MSALNVFACTLGYEISEARECRYQPTRTKIPVYTSGDDYFCVSKKDPGALLDMKWQKHTDQFWAEQSKTVLWISKPEVE